jgi:hypothetical protein
MCGATERLTAFGECTSLLCSHNNNGSQNTVVKHVELRELYKM